MKTGRNLQEVLVELNRQNKAKQDFISPAQGMRLREDGQTFEINHLTTNQQEVFGTTSLFHRQVASALGIPAKYYDLMQVQKPELLAENVNSWFADKPSSYMVRSMDYGSGQVARALLSERYRRIDNMEIATSVLPLFAGNDQYEVMSCEVTENRLYLKVVNHRLEMEVRKGDIVQAGVMISNSEVGLGAVSIQPLVYRMVCTNGMVVNDMGERRHHVGRQAKAVEDSFALYSDETMEAEDKAFLLKLRDTTMAAIDESRFSQVVGRLQEGCMSDEEKEAANKRCPSERYHECALEQSFMELLYSMKRDFEQHGDASMIVTMFDNAYEQAVRLANNNSISVQRMATVENQIKEMEERLQDAISHQVAALREAALEQNVELNEALSNGEVTIDDIDLDIRSGLTPGSIGVSFYGTETEEGSEAQIYTELVNDLQERLKTLQQERQTIEEEQGVLAIMKKNFEYFLACLKELPDTNAGGMPLRVNGLDVQGTLLRDVDGNTIGGRKRAITSGKLKLTPERIAEAPDMLHFEKGIYCAFIESGVLQGDVATYKTNFGVTLTSKGNRRTLDSFMGYKRSDMDGNVVYVDAPYKVYGFSIQYRRYLTTAAKREREEAV